MFILPIPTFMNTNKFCCCWSLRSSAIVAAIITAFSFVFCVVTAIVSFANEEEKLFYYASDVGLSLKAARTCLLVAGCIYLGVFICLILAMLKKNPYFLLPWLVIQIIGMILCIHIVSRAVSDDEFGYRVLIGIIMAGLMLFQVYLWNVVLHYYNQLVAASTNISPEEAKGYRLLAC